ncbi:MAG: L-2-hydroxyglutarate oxidase [Candidatus Methylacidiphilales bacterium]|nr:L-2-hydroxyglutarate oxidase [Candidatus Methylacidiphilales bacterium]
MKKSFEMAVIGGGIVGLGTALALLKKRPSCRLVLFEKEKSCGTHQSTHNSGVLHAGLYYKPGSLKARLAVEGIRRMTAFCAEHAVPHEICGKVVVATNPEEIIRLNALYDRGQQNGLSGLRLLSQPELLQREPHAAGQAALLVPEEGIVDYESVCAALVAEIRQLGGEIATSSRVLKATEHHSEWILQTTSGDYAASFLINCAGLHSDRVATLSGEKPDSRIIPFRGEYYKLKPSAFHLVNHLIYPVPDPTFPFLGVHFTRLIHGGIEAGPNAVLALAREGYRKTDIHLRDLAGSLAYKGLWKFLFRHPSMCWQEWAQSLSPTLFVRALQKLVPSIQLSDIEPGGAGVRAQAMGGDGTLVQDFALIARPRALHVLNAPSPAATASLSIGEEIARRVLD